MNNPTVFISYSHKDEEWKDRLLTHLGVLQEQNLLDIWEDRQIAGGDDWLPEIENALNRANIAVLMISANFLTSKFILGKEVPELLKRREKDNLQIMPLIVKPCAWEAVSWLKRIQAWPKDGRPLMKGTEYQIEEDLAAFSKEISARLRRIPTQPVGCADDKLKYNPPRKIDLTKLPTTNAEIFGRENELELLDKAWDDDHTKIVSFVAWGGVGKSALVNGWLNQMEERNFKGAELVYGWSFYSQGSKESGQASADGFINDALKWFGFDGEIPTSQHERGRLLAEIISRQKTLLILDGLEPLQYPPGEMHGFLKDKSMPGFLKNLVNNINGLCVITTRCAVKDIQTTEGRFSFMYELDNLSETAGKALLKSYDLKGSENDFLDTATEFRCHALALHLVGSYLTAPHNGDLKQRSEIPKLTADEKNGGHARRVMESYTNWFAENNKAELDVLHLLGLFDRPAKKEAMDVLKKEPAIKGLTDRLQNLTGNGWKITLHHLRELRLLAPEDNNEPDTLDCHPLFREHFGEKLEKENPEAWKEAHARLYDYYKNLPEKKLPDTLEEMEPLFAAVRHGCLAGKYNEAVDDVYWERITRKTEFYNTQKLGAFGADLSCLSNFFERLWDKPAKELTDKKKAVVLSWAGFALRAVGRLTEAAQPMKAALEMHINQENWEGSALDACNLSELFLTKGEVADAVAYGRQSVESADKSRVSFEMITDRSTYADALYQSGNVVEAEKLFIEAERMQQKRVPESSFLVSLPGFQYCDLLLSMGKYKEVLERAQTTVKYEMEGWYSLLDIALDKLTIGKALMFLNKFKGAENYLNQAVDGLRASGDQDILAMCLILRAQQYRIVKDFPSSCSNLDEALEIAEYGQMRLHLTDYHLEAARLISAQVSEEKPASSNYQIIENGETLQLTKEEMQAKYREHFIKAEKLINETGYRRRDKELEELRKFV